MISDKPSVQIHRDTNTHGPVNPDPAHVPNTQGSSNKKTAIAMLLVFIAPVVIAYLLLNTGVYLNFGTSNRGVLLDPPANITQLSWVDLTEQQIAPSTLSAHWWLVYYLPQVCDAACEQRLLQLRQSIQTLGPEQNRVKPMLIVSAQSDQKALNTWREQLIRLKHDFITAQPAAPESLLQGPQKQLQKGGLYVVDPMGFAMLYYAPVLNSDDALAQAKSLIKDLKYLLKVSRIG